MKTPAPHSHSFLTYPPPKKSLCGWCRGYRRLHQAFGKDEERVALLPFRGIGAGLRVDTEDR